MARTDCTYYVYALIDPRDNQPFYIGKGKNKRMYNHKREAMIGKTSNAEKATRIRRIIDSGRDVVYQIIKGDLSEQEAFRLEKQTILDIGLDNLTNASRGNDPEAKYRFQAAAMLRRLVPFEILTARRHMSWEEREQYWLLFDTLTEIAEGAKECQEESVQRVQLTKAAEIGQTNSSPL